MQNNMDLYSEYLEEREGLSVYRTEHGFITYSIARKEFRVHEIFVKKEYRDGKEASDLINFAIDLAKSRGCNAATAEVHLDTKTALKALKFQLKCGMIPYKAENNIIKMVRFL